ncbi:MAG: class I SAM-dependent methyltransferase [Gemmatimonadaceae bacterium]
MLYDHPDVYDALLRPEEHVAHYAMLAERHRGPVLELACGSGQLTVPLARSGRSVVGLDSSAPMLAAARRRATDAGVSVEFVEADMRDFDLRRRFALVFIARNSLLHLSTTDDFAAVFAAVRRHLAPDGVLAFDVFNPDVRILAQPAGERRLLMRAHSEMHGELTVESTAEYDAATQVNRATWYISAPGRPDAWVTPIHLRSIFPQELPLLLTASGFRLVSRAGDLRGEVFTSSSARQVCICTHEGATVA